MKGCAGCNIFKKCLSFSLKVKERADLEKNIKQNEWKEGEVIYYETAAVKSIYIIIEGKVAVMQDGVFPYLRIAGEGDYLGLEALSKEKKHVYTTRALSPIITCEFSINYFVDLILNNRDFCLTMMNELHLDYNRLIEFSLRMISGTSESKVAAVILTLCHTNDETTTSKEEMARLTGLTRETVSRMLKKLKDKNFIETPYRKVKVKNSSALQILTKELKL